MLPFISQCYYQYVLPRFFKTKLQTNYTLNSKNTLLHMFHNSNGNCKRKKTLNVMREGRQVVTLLI